MTRHLLRLPFVVAAAVAVAGCSSDSSTTTDTTDNTPCTITMSGARSGPLTCSNLATIETTSNSSTSFGLEGNGATDTLSLAIGFIGAPQVHTYSSTTDASPTGTLVTPVGLWASGPADGSVSLNITSVSVVNSGAGLTKYQVHGTLTMTMAAEVSNGSVGPVSVTATF